jgi:hypothetical protein
MKNDAQDAKELRWNYGITVTVHSIDHKYI